MRAMISLFITSIIVCSFAIEFQNAAIADSGTLDMMASQSILGAKSKKPGQPTPHRGSGRRNAVMEYLANTQNLV